MTKKTDLQRVLTPYWKTKRFWLNLVTLVASGADAYGGYIREILPGKDGAAVLMVLSFTNMYLIARNAASIKRTLENGDIVIADKESSDGP